MDVQQDFEELLELLNEQKATGRTRDLADIEALGEQ